MGQPWIGEESKTRFSVLFGGSSKTDVGNEAVLAAARRISQISFGCCDTLIFCIFCNQFLVLSLNALRTYFSTSLINIKGTLNQTLTTLAHQKNGKNTASNHSEETQRKKCDEIAYLRRHFRNDWANQKV